MNIMKIRITLTEPMLGTSSADPELHSTYIASKAEDPKKADEEVETIKAQEESLDEKGCTVFPKAENGNPFLWDYQVKGFFKDACQMLRKVKNSKSEKIKAYKKEIDGLIFPSPRKIMINMSGPMGECQRPLRAQTMQGERIALSTSEQVPAGSTMDLDIVYLNDSLKDVIVEWLDYGMLRGLGQWRNSGMGRFSWEEIA